MESNGTVQLEVESRTLKVKSPFHPNDIAWNGERKTFMKRGTMNPSSLRDVRVTSLRTKYLDDQEETGFTRLEISGESRIR